MIRMQNQKLVKRDVLCVLHSCLHTNIIDALASEDMADVSACLGMMSAEKFSYCVNPPAPAWKASYALVGQAEARPLHRCNPTQG